MIRNSAKSNWTIEEIGWNLLDKGNLKDWDGLINIFLELCKRNPEFEQNKYVREWKTALLKAMKHFC